MACGLDTERVGKLMKEFDAETKTSIPMDILNTIRAVVVDSRCVQNEEMIETLARCFKENEYILCPHTAVGVAYHYSQAKCEYPQVVNLALTIISFYR